MLFYTVFLRNIYTRFYCEWRIHSKKDKFTTILFPVQRKDKIELFTEQHLVYRILPVQTKKKPRRHRNWGKLWDTPHRLGSCIFSLNFLWLTTTTLALSCAIVGVGFPELGWKKQRKIAKKQFLSERVAGSVGDFFFRFSTQRFPLFHFWELVSCLVYAGKYICALTRFMCFLEWILLNCQAGWFRASAMGVFKIHMYVLCHLKSVRTTHFMFT